MQWKDSGESLPNPLLRRFLMRVLWAVFPPVFRLLYGFRAIGAEKLGQLPQGVVTVCNHVHTLDCVMLACAFRRRRMFFLTLRENFDLPLAGFFVRTMGGVAIPSEASGWKELYGLAGRLLAEGDVLQVYPEGELAPGCRKLREFMPGAFKLAVQYGAPVLPCVLREYPRWHKGLELVVLDPVYPAGKGKKEVARISEEIHRQMAACLQEQPGNPL